MTLLLHWKHKNLIFSFVGLVFAVILSQNQSFQQFIIGLGNYGYIGAFFAGMMFVSTFTIATAALILFTLAKTLTPIELIIIAALGAAMGDLLILRFVREDIIKEVGPIYEQIVGSHLKKILHTKYFAWTLPVIGTLVFISPLPDELGISLMGISEIQPSKFLVISLLSHACEMFFLVSASIIL